ncbi:VWA domain-containing protein [Candidatus Flexifilum breve]|uniref:VWA domain-containing protein n=1 Tax=Candidatus Flexifilum breve TaxID=3140694 RepID=UPI0031CCBC98
MAYQAEISRSNPSMFLFLLDQSGSMADKFGGGGGKKDQKVADAINNLLYNLTIKCAKSEGVRDYYHVGVLGYGAKVGSLLSGSLAEKDFARSARLPTPRSASRSASRRWMTARAASSTRRCASHLVQPDFNGGTPMVQALKEAQRIVGSWLGEHPIRSAHRHQCHRRQVIGWQPARGSVGLARTEKFGRQRAAVQRASVLSRRPAHRIPAQRSRTAGSVRQAVVPNVERTTRAHPHRGAPKATRSPTIRRGFVFNADIVSVIRFLDIGTRPSNLR